MSAVVAEQPIAARVVPPKPVRITHQEAAQAVQAREVIGKLLYRLRDESPAKLDAMKDSLVEAVKLIQAEAWKGGAPVRAADLVEGDHYWLSDCFGCLKESIFVRRNTYRPGRPEYVFEVPSYAGLNGPDDKGFINLAPHELVKVRRFE